MSPKGIVPGMITDIKGYMKKRNRDYRKRRLIWLSNPLAVYDPWPEPWPPANLKCLLVRLPTELVFMIIEDLYQADLAHLAATCRRMAECTIPALYTRDITRFGCLALRWSCTFGIVPTLERTLAYGASVDYEFPDKSEQGCSWVLGGTRDSFAYYTPLLTAIAADEPHAVRTLCAHGADVNMKPRYFSALGCYSWTDYYWLYPLHRAMGDPDWPVRRPGVQAGNPDTVQCLLDAGANPNQTASGRSEPNTYTTPLFLAMQSGVPVETVDLLLRYGADPTIRGIWATSAQWSLRYLQLKRPNTPLSMLLLPVCESLRWPWAFDWEKVRLLLAYGGTDDCRDTLQPEHGPVGYLRTESGYCLSFPDITELGRRFVAEGADVAEWSRRGISPIQAIIWWADMRCAAVSESSYDAMPHTVERICEMVMSIAKATPVGGEPGLPTIVDLTMSLTKFGTDHGKSRRNWAQTSLCYVCSPFCFFRTTQLVRILLNLDANINAACSEGVSALHLAAVFNTSVALRSLLEFQDGPGFSGLNVNARDSQGWTPLHYACHFGFRSRQGEQVNAVWILLSYGADIHARTASGVTPLLLAIWSSNSALVEVLLDYGAGIKDMSVTSLNGQATIPYNPMLDHKTIIFDTNLVHGWFGLDDAVVDGRRRIHGLLKRLHRPGQSAPLGLDSEDSDSGMTDKHFEPSSYSQDVVTGTDTGSDGPGVVPAATADTDEEKKSPEWAPPSVMVEAYRACFSEVEQVTADRVGEFCLNAGFKAYTYSVRLPLVDLAVHGMDVPEWYGLSME